MIMQPLLNNESESYIVFFFQLRHYFSPVLFSSAFPQCFSPVLFSSAFLQCFSLVLFYFYWLAHSPHCQWGWAGCNSRAMIEESVRVQPELLFRNEISDEKPAAASRERLNAVLKYIGFLLSIHYHAVQLTSCIQQISQIIFSLLGFFKNWVKINSEKRAIQSQTYSPAYSAEKWEKDPFHNWKKPRILWCPWKTLTIWLPAFSNFLRGQWNHCWIELF